MAADVGPNLRRVVVHRHDWTHSCWVKSPVPLTKPLAWLMLSAYEQEGGAFAELPADDSGVPGRTPTNLRYLVFDGQGKPVTWGDERPVATVGDSGETHLYLLLPEEVKQQQQG